MIFNGIIEHFFGWRQRHSRIFCGGLMVKLGSPEPIFPFSPSRNLYSSWAPLAVFFGTRNGFWLLGTVSDCWGRFLSVFFFPCSSLFWRYFLIVFHVPSLWARTGQDLGSIWEPSRLLFFPFFSQPGPWFNFWSQVRIATLALSTRGTWVCWARVSGLFWISVGT